MEIKKTDVRMTKPMYLGLSILDISKTLMYQFWYDYIKPMYEDKEKLCYTDTDSFDIYIKIEDFYEDIANDDDIANDVKWWFDTSNCVENDKRPLPIGKNKKVIGHFKHELGGKVMTEFVALRARTYAYLMEDGNKHKKGKRTKNSVLELEIMFKSYKDSFFNNEIILKSQQKFRINFHKV